MHKKLSWQIKAMSATLEALGVITGILSVMAITVGSLELPGIIGLFIATAYFFIWPLLLKQTTVIMKTMILSAAMITAPLVPIGMLILNNYICGKPLNTMRYLVYTSGGTPISTISFIGAWIFFFCCALLLCFYFQSRKHNY